MKKSNQFTHDDDHGVDRISNLPDPILHMILSLLDTIEEVARSSILSTRWRYLWTSLPSVDISCTRVKPFNQDNFTAFVFHVLFSSTLDLYKFLLCCGNHYSMLTVTMWILVAGSRNVRVLELLFRSKNGDKDMVLPHCLVTCESLEALRLLTFGDPLQLPNVVWFPSLRVLELEDVELLSHNVILKKFLEGCPLLEHLGFRACDIENETLSISSVSLKSLQIHYWRRGDWEEPNEDDRDTELNPEDSLWLDISCPKLEYFEYAGHMASDFFYKNLEFLKEAVIYPKGMAQKDLWFDEWGYLARKFLAVVFHVESLSLNLFFIRAIAELLHLKLDFPASFPNLKVLDVSTTIDSFTMNAAIRILKVSPNLECFYLVIEKEILSTELWELDEFLTCRLKKVRFVKFKGEKQKLDMARFLLKHGNALELMVFIWSGKVSYHEKMKTMTDVSTFLKASSRVKIESLI